jgi:hypothetical protein
MPTVSNRALVGDHIGIPKMFAPARLTLGVLFPIEAFQRDEPTMRDQERLARSAEELGFPALRFQDVPLCDPNFSDIGQIYDPWVYLGWIAAQTRTAPLATDSIILPLRHPLHTAKAAASVDRLSGGRLVLGVASGDRPIEFPAFDVDLDQRDALFRETVRVIRELLDQEFTIVESSTCRLFGTADLVPEPVGRMPILGIDSSRQPWTGLSPIRTAGSPTRDPSNRGRNSSHAGLSEWPPQPRVSSIPSPNRGDRPTETLDLMSLFLQPMRRQPAVEYLTGCRWLSRAGVPTESPRT